MAAPQQEHTQVAAMKMDLKSLQMQIDAKLKARLSKQNESEAAVEGTHGGDGNTAAVEHASPHVITSQHKRSNSKRYHNTAWESSSVRRQRGPNSPSGQDPASPGMHDSTSSGGPLSPKHNCPPQRHSHTVLQSQIFQYSNDDLPLPPPPEDMQTSQSAELPKGGLQLQDLPEGGQHLQQMPKGKYGRLHLYMHGVPLGCYTPLTERQRMVAFEAKFDLIKELLESSGVEVLW